MVIVGSNSHLNHVVLLLIPNWMTPQTAESFHDTYT